MKYVLVIVVLVVMCVPQRAPAEDALVLHTAGVHQLLADPRDSGLREALKHINPRLMELPMELDGMDIPMPMVILALETLQSPMTLRLGIDEAALDSDEMPITAQLIIHDDARGTLRERSRELIGMMQMFAPQPIEPDPAFAGMMRMETPDGDVHFGLWERDDEPLCFVVSFNRDDPAPAVDLPATELPADIQPVGIAHLDMPQFEPLMDMLFMLAGPDAFMSRRQLEEAGMIGPDAMILTAAVGHGEDRAHIAGRLRRMAGLHRQQGMMPQRMLARDDLRLVPADATIASISRGNIAAAGADLKKFIEQIEVAADETFVSDFLAQAKIDLEDDLLAHLGELTAFYMADRTGGGGLLSAVMLIETTAGEALGDSLLRMEQTINEIVREETSGYVRFDRDQTDGMTLTTLRFAGLPVPFELCYTITDGVLVMGATPSAVREAVAQRREPGPSLLDLPGFRDMGGERAIGALGVNFIDMPRKAANGYGSTSFMMAAVRNSLHSPRDIDRRVPPLMLSYAQLLDGAQPMVLITRVDGDDYQFDGQFDQSMMANTTAAIGTLSNSGMTVRLLTTAMFLPALHQARTRAIEYRTVTQLRKVAMAALAYAAENDDRVPSSLDDLVEQRYITPDLLVSPFGPVGDGQGDIWMSSRHQRFSMSHLPDREILAYDRAMFANHHLVAVLFYDGHVEVLDHWEFLERVEDALHQGIDFNLPDLGW
ncbi:MAG: hypothetical protein EA377_07445 [Phycisphaerales bacterium]|nr:MAG: hypothetical protein EA377_07445 [Phycisphaerales bacterium]